VPDIVNLTEREKIILELAARGYTDKAIAKELGLCIGTIKNNTVALLRKLSAENKTQAVAIAIRAGII
jgi:DNA-binding NarL/FixJ family response regulator